MFNCISSLVTNELRLLIYLCLQIILGLSANKIIEHLL